jgi:D-3-phosphoglycerate dehydrogenase
VPKVLIADKLSPEGIEILEAADGLEVLNKPGMSPEELLEVIPDIDGLVIRSGAKVTAEVIAAATNLKVVGRAGIGVDNVDIPAATERGIVVMNTPFGNNITTAEHAVALIVSLARHIPQATASMKAGKWEKSKFSGLELYRRNAGVIGAGNIGRVVVERLQGLGMNVIVYDPYLNEEAAKALGVECVDFDEFCERADVITVHVPKVKETLGLLGAEAFKKVKPGVLIVNAARGGIVDEDALLDALNSGQVGGAALDVYVEEPVNPDHPLVNHPNVICTPHLGASTGQAQLNVAISVAEQVRDYVLNGVVSNALNMPSVSPEVMEKVRPYVALGEKIGRFQGQICKAGIKEIEIELAGEVAELDAAPITSAILKGLLECVTDHVNMVNAGNIAEKRGIRVVHSKSSKSEDFASIITTKVTGEGPDRLIAGAVFHGGQPRIVRVDDFMLEAIPEGATLFINNHDRPGVVGMVGQILGEAGVNISRMQLALSPESKQAAMLVNIDSAPVESVLENLRGHADIISAQVLEL